MSGTNDFSYLNVLSKPLDDHQEKVCFSNRNTVVAAGAGSGKTEVLAKRFAWLIISCGIKVQEILTLTFTNKAAAEMYQRIHRTLRTLADSPDVSEEVKQKAKHALMDFSLAHIQTLDSYNVSILRQCANRYGIKPDFTTGTTDGKRDVKDAALRFMINHCDNEVLSHYCEPGKIQDFAENVLAEAINENTSIASPDDFFTQKLEFQAEIASQVFNHLVFGKKISPDTDCSIFSALENSRTLSQYVEECNNALSLELDQKKDTATKKAEFIKEINKFFSMASDFAGGIEITGKDITDNSDRMKQCQADFKNMIDQALKCINMSGYIASIRSIIKKSGDFHTSFAATLDSIFEYSSQFENTKKMMELFDEFMREINSSKRQTGKLSFPDVSSMALKVLVENEDIRNQEKRAYKKIMIDEFQDNNGMNRDLLYILSLKDGEFESSDGSAVIEYDKSNLDSLHQMIKDRRDENKLFFVGDEKQSIYKFRKADVSVFRQLAQENESLSMTYNYRSSPELLTAFNLLFGEHRIFDPEKSNIKYEAQYTKPALKKGIEILPTLKKDTVPVHVYMVDKKKLIDGEHFLPAEDQNAYYIAKKIREIVEKEKCPFSAITILDKSRKDRKTIQKYLAMFSIPYEVDQYKNIFESGLVSDFYYFLKLCIYPSDSQAFAAYLCSPLAGLSENAVEEILSYLVADGTSPFDPLDDSHDGKIKEDISQLDWEKFVDARNFYRDYRTTVLKQKICTTVSELFHYRAYKYETYLSSETQLYREQFDLLFELARTTDESGKSLGWFLDEMTSLKKNSFQEKDDLNAEEITYPLERRDSVKIMTIHKSKGLQKEHVFIWGCTNVRNRGEKSQSFFQEDTGLSLKNLDMSSNFFLLVQKKLFEKQEVAEFRRLLYVAITRAISSVHIVGQWDSEIKEENSFAILEKIILKLYPDCKGEDADYETIYKDGAPFDYTNIQPVKYFQLNESESLDEIRNATIKAMQELKVPEEEHLYAVNAIPRKSPSHIHDESISAEQKISAVDQYLDLNEILLRYENSTSDEEEEKSGHEEEELNDNVFRASDFGTLIHDYLCKMGLGVVPGEYEPDFRMFKNLNDVDREKIKAICVRMCMQFAKNGLYRDFLESKNQKLAAKNEYAFAMYDGQALYHGSIDLIYQKPDGEVIIVDYKTDRSIIPERHLSQQKCYREAAKSLIPDAAKISCYLHYLRFDKTVKILEDEK
ncbi:MAG: UvrD-helicase domain-containing protein [Treponema sp.]|nr:UvrD-helicase domain-containing protein [Treponema sp.]